MTFKYLSLCGVVTAAAALVGCGNNDSPPPAPAPAPMPAAPVMPAAPMTAPEAPTTMMAPPSMGPAASMPTTAPAPDAPMTMPMPMAPVAPVPPPMAPAMTPTTSPSEAQAMATKLISEGVQYVKDNKLDLAQTAVTKLDGMRSSLPASFGPKIDQLKTMLTAAQMANGKFPGGFKMPG